MSRGVVALDLIPWTKPKASKIPQRRLNLASTKRKIYLRTKVWQCYKHGLHQRSTEALIGCSREEFLEHIDEQLHSGMTNANYGKFWHLDHIIPCARFDLHNHRQRHACFNWSNYQPMLAHDNRVKSDRVLS
jgi:hypothetical protein